MVQSVQEVISETLTLDEDQFPLPISTAGMVKASDPIRRDCAVSGLTAGTFTEIVPTIQLDVQHIHFFNGTGVSIRLGVGASGAETVEYIVPPGGDIMNLMIDANSRVSLNPYENISSGEIVINFVG